MARLPRNKVFDENEIGIYHCMNRCVRQAFLMGADRDTGKSFDHRREWVRLRLEELASIFAIDHLNFSIMGNHFHCLVRNRPDLRDAWSSEEVVRRWWRLFPDRRRADGEPDELTPDELTARMNDHQWVAERRARLGHISWFMRCLAEKIAKQANAEDEISSRFWQGRFKMLRILDECALLACAMYIDLNPIRARLAETPETSFFTSVYERLQGMSFRQDETLEESNNRETAGEQSVSVKRKDSWLSPVKLTPAEPKRDQSPAAAQRGYLDMTFEEYVCLLDWTGRQIREDKRGSIPDHLAPIFERLRINGEVWVAAVANFSRWFRTAAGRAESLASEAARRGRRFLHGMSHCRAVFL